MTSGSSLRKGKYSYNIILTMISNISQRVNIIKMEITRMDKKTRHNYMFSTKKTHFKYKGTYIKSKRVKKC